MKDELSHEGIVREVGPKITRVAIEAKSACASCHAAGLCASLDATTKDIEVSTALNPGYQEGDKVEVVLGTSMGAKAVLLAYVVPLFILLILVVSLSYTSIHELLIGAIGLGGMAIWYGVVYLFRDRLSREYVFYLRRPRG
jgi:sigma-E factor negative regulatory protein RseC